jgi:hypothetical protein
LTDSDAITNDETAPIRRIGDWTFRGDLARDPFKTGWIYESAGLRNGKRQRMVTELDCNSSSNELVFRCSNVQYGRVKVGYLASYGLMSCSGTLSSSHLHFIGSEWGSTQVSVTSAQSTPSGLKRIAEYPPVMIESLWSWDVSIRMEKEILLKDLMPPRSQEATSSQFCSLDSQDPSPSDCVSELLISIQFCPSSGSKFKVLSVACC